jgi:hypothetical protein
MSQLQRQPNQARIRGHTQRRQNHDGVPAGAKLAAVQAILANLREELAVPLLPPEDADQQHARAVHREQRADAVELGRKHLEHDERERKRRQGCADVGAFERALGRAHLDHFVRREDGGARAVEAQVVVVCGVSLLLLVGFLGEVLLGAYLEHAVSCCVVGEESGLRR